MEKNDEESLSEEFNIEHTASLSLAGSLGVVMSVTTFTMEQGQGDEDRRLQMKTVDQAGNGCACLRTS